MADLAKTRVLYFTSAIFSALVIGVAATTFTQIDTSVLVCKEVDGDMYYVESYVETELVYLNNDTGRMFTKDLCVVEPIGALDE